MANLNTERNIVRSGVAFTGAIILNCFHFAAKVIDNFAGIYMDAKPVVPDMTTESGLLLGAAGAVAALGIFGLARRRYQRKNQGTDKDI